MNKLERENDCNKVYYVITLRNNTFNGVFVTKIIWKRHIHILIALVCINLQQQCIRVIKFDPCNLRILCGIYATSPMPMNVYICMHDKLFIWCVLCTIYHNESHINCLHKN